jgi:hypothetical protein
VADVVLLDPEGAHPAPREVVEDGAPHRADADDDDVHDGVELTLAVVRRAAGSPAGQPAPPVPGLQQPALRRRAYIHHRVDGGETNPNGLLLCTRRHALVHEGAFRVVRDGDEVRVLSPRGDPLDARGIPVAAPPPPAVHDLPPTWDGNPFDYGAAVESLVAASP